MQDKRKHLAAIHPLPTEHWQGACKPPAAACTPGPMMVQSVGPAVPCWRAWRPVSRPSGSAARCRAAGGAAGATGASCRGPWRADGTHGDGEPRLSATFRILQTDCSQAPAGMCCRWVLLAPGIDRQVADRKSQRVHTDGAACRLCRLNRFRPAQRWEVSAPRKRAA